MQDLKTKNGFMPEDTGGKKQQAQAKTRCQKVLGHPDKSAPVKEHSMAVTQFQHSDIFRDLARWPAYQYYV